MEKEKDGTKDEEDILAHNPRAINVAEFAGARAAELKTMTDAIVTMGGMRRTFQKLPRHLRRRAMSHDLRRLPKRLRESEERVMNKCANKKKSGQGKEGDGETAAPAKRSRRHRRRPSNLREEYQRRQRSHTWLETHIWHAKRFKMAELWGHRLALHPSDKSVRATYRALVKHCLIQDISYMKVIEVSGQQGLILRALSHLTSPSTGLTCAAASYLSGQQHGDTILYKYDRFPEGALGTVNFLWKAEECLKESQNSTKPEETTTVEPEGTSSARTRDKFENRSTRQLWFWAHPACVEVLVKELQTACENKNKEAVDNSNVIMVKQLEESPIRFRLQGPLCHPVLLDTLKVADISVTPGSTSNPARRWWETYYSKPDKVHIQAEQSSTWEALHGIQKTAVLPPRCVLGLTVRDPRNLLPIKKRKVMPDPEEFVATDCLPVDILHGFPTSVSVSPIWEESVQKAVKSTQVPVHKLNKMRAELLVPGTELSLGREESRIPVLLLQYPGVTHSAGMATTSSKQRGVAELGSGWDLIVPSGWGMAFWVALIYRGARAAGLLQSRSCALQQGFHHFPEGYPDTAAGQEHEEAKAKELMDKFKRWPPAKRPNYGKLGVVSPFQCPWKKLLSEWGDAKLQVTEAEEEQECDMDVTSPLKGVELAPELVSNTELPYFVLRDKFKLESLNKLLVTNQWPARVSKDAKSDAGSAVVGTGMVACNGPVAHHALTESKESPRGHPETVISAFRSGLQDSSARTLVGVKLCMVNRGVPTPYAMICLPSTSDLASFSSDPKHCPVEPIHKEFKLPRPMKKEKKKKHKNKSKVENQDKLEKVREPLEISQQKKLLDSSTRRIIGFVTDGAHTFVSGSGRGVGYCCMLGLMTLLEERPQGQRVLVLVRDTKTVQYRFAHLGVVT